MLIAAGLGATLGPACCAGSAPPGNALIEQDGMHSGRLGLHQHFLFANLYQPECSVSTSATYPVTGAGGQSHREEATLPLDQQNAAC
jgi:hypothetical protein